MAAWYWASVRATSSALSRVSMPTSSPRMVTGWPPSWKTAISDELRVRADGFWNTQGDPPAGQDTGRVLVQGQVEHAGQFGRGQVVDVEKVPGHAGATSRATAEDVDGLVYLRFADQQRGGQAQGAVGDGVDDQALFQALRPPPAWPRRRTSSTPSSRPRPRTARTEGRAANFSCKYWPRSRDRRGTSCRLHDGQGGPGRRRRQRLASERRRVVTGHERRRHFRARPARPDGDAVAQRLGHGDDVRADPVVLETPPAAGAAEAGLDLVDHEQQVPLVAQPAHGLEVLGPGRPYATFALDRFEQYGRHFRGHRLFHGLDVLPGHMPETVREGLEGLVLGGLAGGVQRGQGPPVERTVSAQHHIAPVARPFAGQL